MPASDLEWSSLGSGTIFHVFGTKRKATEQDAMETHHCMPQNDKSAKRRCSWQQQQQQQQQHVMQEINHTFAQDPLLNNNNNNNILPGTPHLQMPSNNSVELNHNSPAMQDQHQLYEQQQITHPGVTHVMSQQPPRVPSPWPLQQPFHHVETEDHIMDLNEGTYSPAVSNLADIDTACSSMEADSPAPDQYTTTAQEHRQVSPSTEFCKSYCGSGEKSPGSGRVRCFCKPSWEGMLDMKPYISDVY